MHLIYLLLYLVLAWIILKPKARIHWFFLKSDFVEFKNGLVDQRLVVALDEPIFFRRFLVQFQVCQFLDGGIEHGIVQLSASEFVFFLDQGLGVDGAKSEDAHFVIFLQRDICKHFIDHLAVESIGGLVMNII